MNQQLKAYLGRKFFPHFLPHYQVLAIEAIEAAIQKAETLKH